MGPHDAVMQVRDEDWMGHREAAEELGLPRWRLRLLIANGHVYRARNSDGDLGVARDSVQAEAQWRHGASPLKRAKRLAGDALTWGPVTQSGTAEPAHLAVDDTSGRSEMGPGST